MYKRQSICSEDIAPLVLTANITAGDPTPTIQWFDSGVAISGQNGTTLTVNPSATTTYSVEAINVCGTATATTTITVNNTPVLNPSFMNVSCPGANDGGIDLGISGTNTFNWSGPTAIGNTSTVNNLSGGVYEVTVTDGNGCIVTATIPIGEATPMIINITPTDPSCANDDGQAEAIVTDGTSPYSYAWGTTANNQTTATAIDLAAGTYTVTVTDANSCIATQNVTLTGPNPFAVVITSQAPTCGQSNGQALAAPSGGAPPFTYDWSNIVGTNDGNTITGAVSYTHLRAHET